jgi:hypothetical protein
MQDNLMRWLYRGHRPNRIARIINRAWATIFSTGITPGYATTLEVTGRKSGRIISQPMMIAIVDGERYLVSMLGEQVQWVHNVRAAGGKAALLKNGREEVQLEEIPAELRAPILKAYLQIAPGGRPHIPVDKDAPVTAFAEIAAAFPVFRVTSRAATPSTN